MTTLRHDERRTESGAVLVEAAIALTFLLIMCAGIFEYAHVFTTTRDVSSAVGLAARTGSFTTANGPAQDYDIIQSAVQKAGEQRTGIERIIIYRADDANGKPPRPCMVSATSPPGQKCNVYRKDELGLSESALNVKSNTKGWPPAERLAGYDFIGVWVEKSRTPMFGLVSSPDELTDYQVYKMSPNPATSDPSSWEPPTTGVKADWDEKNEYGCYDGDCWNTGKGGGPGSPGGSVGGGGGGSG